MMGGQKTCPKHVEFYSKNSLDILVHLFGFVIRKFCTAVQVPVVVI
jgi:hypothetical protein